MKKSIGIAALFLVMTVPTITAYASWDWTTAKQYETGKPFKPASYGVGGINSPWMTLSSRFKDYPGRIEGTWQKSDDYFFYYVLPDGSYLKNAYVDAVYIPWTGAATAAISRSTIVGIDYVMQNTFYGGQMPYDDQFDNSWEKKKTNTKTKDLILPADFSPLSALEKYRSGNYPELDYLKEAYDWMDAQMPSLMQLSETERAKQMALLLAEKLTYTVTDDCAALCFHTGQAGENGFSSLYRQFAVRAGFRYSFIEGNESYQPRPNDRWNNIVADGKYYYVDITLYKETGDEKFLFTDDEHQWMGCATVEEKMAQSDASMRHSQEIYHNLTDDEREARLAALRQLYEEMYK